MESDIQSGLVIEHDEGESDVSRTIWLWAENIDLANTTGGSNGISKSIVMNKLLAIPSEELTEEQTAAIQEIKKMDFSTGINTDRIRELARLF
jgi:hypothetical protein